MPATRKLDAEIKYTRKKEVKKLIPEMLPTATWLEEEIAASFMFIHPGYLRKNRHSQGVRISFKNGKYYYNKDDINESYNKSIIYTPPVENNL